MILVIMVLSSCKGSNVKTETTTYRVDGLIPVDVLTIDSCEYIRITSGNSTWGSHKGNCKFCLKRNKKF